VLPFCLSSQKCEKYIHQHSLHVLGGSTNQMGCNPAPCIIHWFRPKYMYASRHFFKEEYSDLDLSDGELRSCKSFGFFLSFFRQTNVLRGFIMDRITIIYIYIKLKALICEMGSKSPPKIQPNKREKSPNTSKD